MFGQTKYTTNFSQFNRVWHVLQTIFIDANEIVLNFEGDFNVEENNLMYRMRIEKPSN